AAGDAYGVAGWHRAGLGRRRGDDEVDEEAITGALNEVRDAGLQGRARVGVLRRIGLVLGAVGPVRLIDLALQLLELLHRAARGGRPAAVGEDQLGVNQRPVVVGE